MNNKVSPKFQMKLIKEVHDEIWKEFQSYKEVNLYITKWHEYEEDINGYYENFSFINRSSGEIDLLPTLHSMSGEDILKIAIDLGVDTPDFIPSIPTFKNVLKEEYKIAFSVFQKAYRQIQSDPGVAIGLVNSALEGIIKEILRDERISIDLKGSETLYRLTILIIKEFKLKNDDFPKEIKTIANSLITINQSIEKLRSEMTDFHGKTEEDTLISEEIFATLVVNSVTTVGLFLNSFYKRKYPQAKNELIVEDDDYDDLPF